MELTTKEQMYESKYGQGSLRVLKVIYDEAKEKGYCDLTDNEIISKAGVSMLRAWLQVSIYKKLEEDNLIKRETSELIEKPYTHRKRKIYVNELPNDMLEIFYMRSLPLHNPDLFLVSHKEMAKKVAMSTAWLHQRRYAGEVKEAEIKKDKITGQKTIYYHANQEASIKQLIKQKRKLTRQNEIFGTYGELQNSTKPDKNDVQIYKLKREIISLKEQMKQNQLGLSLRLVIMETLIEKNIKVDMQIVEYLVGSILDWHNNIVYRKENK